MALEKTSQFVKRKKDHINLSLDKLSQASGKNGADRICLIHEALPEINFEDIDLNIKSLGYSLKSPFFISSMTAGHDESLSLNTLLAQSCEKYNWWFGVGSQRRQLFDVKADVEWERVRQSAPSVSIMGNIGISQLIQTPTKDIQKLCDKMQAVAMIVHLNPLQECLQKEGTPQFKGGLKAIEKLCKDLDRPVVVKETGCGMSASTMKSLDQAGVSAIDVSGFGGTHWGRVEHMRADFCEPDKNNETIKKEVGASFYDWGIPTLESLLQAREAKLSCEIWASGGVRSGVEAYKFLALGACRVGLAQPILQAAFAGQKALSTKIEALEYELKVAMFCTGIESLKNLKDKVVWHWNRM